jgi:hypothetical protein
MQRYWLGGDGRQLRANPVRGIDNWHAYIGAAYLANRGFMFDPDSQDGDIYNAMFDHAFVRVAERDNKLWADSNGHRLSSAQQQFLQAKQLKGFDVVLNNAVFAAVEAGQRFVPDIAKAA